MYTLPGPGDQRGAPPPQTRLEDNLKLRKNELAKIDVLEDKIAAEMEGLKENMRVVHEQTAKYRALDEMRNESEAQRERLSALKAALPKRLDLLASTAESKGKHVQAKGEQLQVLISHALRFVLVVWKGAI